MDHGSTDVGIGIPFNSNHARLTSNHLRLADTFFDFRVDFVDRLGSQKKTGPRVTLSATANRLRQALSVAPAYRLSGGPNLVSCVQGRLWE